MSILVCENVRAERSGNRYRAIAEIRAQGDWANTYEGADELDKLLNALNDSPDFQDACSNSQDADCATIYFEVDSWAAAQAIAIKLRDRIKEAAPGINIIQSRPEVDI